MRWKKLGKVFLPSGELPWMASHAANPVAIQIDADLYRVYFSSRDLNNRSSIGWVEIDTKKPTQVLRVSQEPCLTPGLIGCFDDSGASIGGIIKRDGKFWLYYMGWNLGVTVPWRNSIGLATSDDGLHFERVSLAPVMDRSDVDPYTLSYPCVLQEPDGLRLWYGSNLEWGTNQSDMHHMIKSAASTDGLNWKRDGRVLIHPTGSAEYAFARPSVLRDAEGYHMWYAYRGTAYRIGYAMSQDGENWIRMDAEAGIEVSPNEWDSESVEYPFVFDHSGQRYMFYCGNGYGRTGFGVAVLEEA